MKKLFVKAMVLKDLTSYIIYIFNFQIMNLKNKAHLFLIALSILFSACSKDKMLEMRLHKNEGEWKINHVNWTVVYQSQNGQTVRSGTTYDAGTFTFDKGGKGSYSYSIDTIQRTGSFNWQVEDRKVTITSINQSFSFGSNVNINQKAIAYTGTETKKNEIVMEGSETEQEAGSSITQFSLTGTFYLNK